METKNTKRKENLYVVDEDLQICTIATALTKKLNPNVKLWELESLDNVKWNNFECVVDNDPLMIAFLKENYLIFYDSANDLRRTKRTNPIQTPYELNGYFWAWNIYTKERLPLARLIWTYKTGKTISPGMCIDHNNDMHNMSILSNLMPCTQTQNKNKLRWPRRQAGDYSITLVSHPEGFPVKLLRFIDDSTQTQELLVYDTVNGIDAILEDLNSFKCIAVDDADGFKRHFEELKDSSKSYIAYSKQNITSDSFERELFYMSINWTEVKRKVRLRQNQFQDLI